MMMQLIIPGVPISGNHEKIPVVSGKTARGTPRFRMVATPQAKAYEKRIASIALAGVALTRWVMPDYCRVDVWIANIRADRDNVLKPLMDALEGIVFAHDSRILDGRTLRLKDKFGPRVVLQIRPVDGKLYGMSKPRRVAVA